MDSPEGIAIDHLGRTLFWTDSVKDRIEVASLDGSQRRVIVDTDLVNPRAIIADPNNGCVSFLGQPFNAAFQLLVFPFLFDRVSCLTLGKKTHLSFCISVRCLHPAHFHSHVLFLQQ